MNESSCAPGNHKSYHLLSAYYVLISFSILIFNQCVPSAPVSVYNILRFWGVQGEKEGGEHFPILNFFFGLWS